MTGILARGVVRGRWEELGKMGGDREEKEKR